MEQIAHYAASNAQAIQYGAIHEGIYFSTTFQKRCFGASKGTVLAATEVASAIVRATKQTKRSENRELRGGFYFLYII
jgi:hypothetical protein